MNIRNLMSGALTGLLLLGGASASYAVADIAVLGATISPAPATFPNGPLESYSFQVNNNGTSTSNALVKLTISLTKLDFNDGTFDPATDIVQTAGSTPFTWSWDPAIKMLTGTLNGTFSQFAANTFQIKNLAVTAASDMSNPNIGGLVNVTTPAALNSSLTNDDTEAYTYSMAPLPVTLSAFNATPDHCSAVLSWTTTEERNFDYFSVESSTDARTYTTVTKIKSKGDGGASYEYTAGQQANTTYYRLKMVDVDGHFKYSDIKPVYTDCNTAVIWSLYPNPVRQSEQVYVKLTAGNDMKTVQVKAVDALGRSVISKQYNVVSGDNTYLLPQLANGTYMISLINAAGKQVNQTQKLVIAN